MPDDGDEIELPRYARHIGVARGTVASPWAADPTGATAPGVPGASARSIGVLSPFAGLLGGPAGPGVHPAPAFSYLTLGPSVVERTLERETVLVGPDSPSRETEDGPGTTGELRVRHLLRGDPTPSPDTPGRSRPADDRAAPGPDRSVTDGPRPTLRSEPDETPEPVRELAVLDTDRPGGRAGGREDGPTAVRDVTVLGTERLTVLERVRPGTPSTGDRSREPTVDRTGTPTSGTRPDAVRAPGGDEPTGLSHPPTVTAVTNTTVQRPSPTRSEGPPGAVELRVREAGGPTSVANGSRPRSAPVRGSDTAPGPDGSSPADRSRPPPEGTPELTVVTARPAEASDGPRRPDADGALGNGRRSRNGYPLGGDRPRNGTGPEGPERRPGQDTTMDALLDDTTEMNRLVDRLHREFQRKARIERERRGL